MSAPLPDNISPVAPEQFHEIFQPRAQLATRLVLALLALVYAYWVPSALVLTPYLVFLTGTIIYISVQGLLTLSMLLNGARPALLSLLTLVDIVAAAAALLNDPGLFPPLVFLMVAALAMAAAQHRLRSFTALFTSALVATVIVLLLRQQLIGQAMDFAFFSLVIATLAGVCALPLLAAYFEQLRLRSAQVTDLDPLTGLGNRWTFYEAAKYLLPYHHRNLTPMVVMFAEIEVAKRKGRKITKPINDFLIKQFASIADQRLRSSDVASYYGRNEFAFLLVDTTTKDAETVAFDLQQQFNEWAKQKDLPAYAHIGMAVVPHRPVALDQILISINAALYRARQYKKGVSGAVFADAEQVR